jgi:large subunit ribosomal protein L15
LKGYKILGNGELTRPLTIYASAFSKGALEKIKKAGGKAIVKTEE